MANFDIIKKALSDANAANALFEIYCLEKEFAVTKKRIWDIGMEPGIIEESVEPLKIGLDIHGVIDAKPKFFSKFSIRLRSRGHTVYIITGAKITPKLIEKLREIGMEWDHLLSITDFHVNKKDVRVHFDEKGNPWMDQEVWDETKAQMCKEHKIDMLIDDSNVYGRYITKIGCKTTYLQVKPIRESDTNGRYKSIP